MKSKNYWKYKYVVVIIPFRKYAHTRYTRTISKRFARLEPAVEWIDYVNSLRIKKCGHRKQYWEQAHLIKSTPNGVKTLLFIDLQLY